MSQTKKIMHEYDGLLKIALKTLLPALIINYQAHRCWQIQKFYYLSYVCGLLLLWAGLSSYFWGRYRELKSEQFLIFLEYLSGKVSVGQTLESALLTAPDDLEQQLGRHSKTHLGLVTMRKMLSVQIDLETVLERTCKLFSSRQSRVFFSVIPFLRQYGGKLEDYVRETHRSLSEELRLQKVIASEQSAKHSEALMMVIMPFLFALIMNLQKGDAPDRLSLVPTILYLCSMSAAAFTLFILNFNIVNKLKFHPLKISNKKVTNKSVLLIADSILRYSPLSFHVRIVRYLEQIALDSQDIWYRYIRKKLQLTCLGLLLALPGLIFPSQPQWSWLLLPIAIGILQDMEVLRLYQQQQLCYNLTYPTFLSLIANLLHSGLTLTKGLNLIFESFECEDNRIISKDLKLLRQKIESGIPARLALLELSQKIKQTEIVSALHLMSRYDRDGGSELLEILSLQATNSRELYKDSVRKKLQQRALLLLLPMGMDLAIVMVTAVLPALVAFNTAF